LDAALKRKVVEGYALGERDTANTPHMHQLRRRIEALPDMLRANLSDKLI
jgi:hypothetical protein